MSHLPGELTQQGPTTTPTLRGLEGARTASSRRPRRGAGRPPRPTCPSTSAAPWSNGDPRWPAESREPGRPTWSRADSQSDPLGRQGDLVHGYSRAQALADGVLVD